MRSKWTRIVVLMQITSLVSTAAWAYAASALVGMALVVAAPTTAGAQGPATNPVPATIVPFLDASGAYHVTKDVAMNPQILIYDPKSRAAATPAGPDLKQANSPIPMRILSFNFGGFSGSACAIYKNVIFDLKRLQSEKELTFAYVGGTANDPSVLQLVGFEIEGRHKVLLDKDYTAFADDATSMASGGPFVTIDLFAFRFVSEGKYDHIPSLHGVLKRDGGPDVPFETSKDGEAKIELDGVREATVVAVATDASGQTIERPIPLPIKGAEKGLVVQSVFLHFGKPRN